MIVRFNLVSAICHMCGVRTDFRKFLKRDGSLSIFCRLLITLKSSHTGSTAFQRSCDISSGSHFIERRALRRNGGRFHEALRLTKAGLSD